MGALPRSAAWLALGALPAAAAGMYKWTDDQGIVHYSDQMPRGRVSKGGVVIDKQGGQVKKIDATADAGAGQSQGSRRRAPAPDRQGAGR